MQTITNEARISRGQRLGKIGTLGGLGLLVAGLVISLIFRDSVYLLVSFGCLILGIIVSSVGTLNMNRWMREPRADQALEQGLKGFDDRYRLYNYLLPAPHVLLGPLGVYVLTAMGQDGVIRHEGGKLRRKFSAGRLLRFMGDEGLGRPFAEADSQAEAMRRLLADQGLDEGVDVQGVLVFYNPRVQLSVVDPALPVVNPKGLKKVIRKQQDGKLSSSQLRQIQELFDSVAG